jgi:hypothetical protein
MAVEVDARARDSDVVPVALPRVWLLTTGWRRHGLIDPNEVPAARLRRPRR